MLLNLQNSENKPWIFLCSKVVWGLIIEGLSLRMARNTYICFDILKHEYWKVTTNLCPGNLSEHVILQNILESFRLKDEDNYEDNI